MNFLLLLWLGGFVGSLDPTTIVISVWGHSKTTLTKIGGLIGGQQIVNFCQLSKGFKNVK